MLKRLRIKFICINMLIAAAMLSALIHSRSRAGKPAPPLTVELPKYRMPRPVNLLREMGGKLRDFIVRAGTIVFLSCVVIDLLGMLTPRFTVAASGSESILAALGRCFSPLFSLIGIADGRLVSALAAGFFAKESIVSTVEILIPEGLAAVLSPAGAASFAAFSLLYAPCVATVSAIRKELGRGAALYAVLRCLLFAFLFSFLVYTGARLVLFFA